MTNIAKQIESVTKLHGGEREQTSKYASFVRWQLAQRAAASGIDPSPVLHPMNDGRVITHATVSENEALANACKSMSKMKAFT